MRKPRGKPMSPPSIADFAPDPANANQGTERGRSLLEHSLRTTGAGRSIVVDKHGTIIAGSKTHEAWGEISDTVQVVHTDGHTLVIVQRDDLDLTDPTGPARQLAYLDNRTGEVGLQWAMEQVAADLQAGVDLTQLWRPDELQKAFEASGLPVQDPWPTVAQHVPGQEEKSPIHCPACGQTFIPAPHAGQKKAKTA
jgi:hypothetical protein